MPVYEASCPKCGAHHEYIRSVANYLDTPECCGVKTDKRIFSPPMGMVDIPAYESPASGKWITSRSERREDFKRTGTREWEGMASERREADKHKAAAADAADKALDHTVRTAWQNLPDTKKQAALAEIGA